MFLGISDEIILNISLSTAFNSPYDTITTYNNSFIYLSDIYETISTNSVGIPSNVSYHTPMSINTSYYTPIYDVSSIIFLDILSYLLLNNRSYNI